MKNARCYLILRKWIWSCCFSSAPSEPRHIWASSKGIGQAVRSCWQFTNLLTSSNVSWSSASLPVLYSACDKYAPAWLCTHQYTSVLEMLVMESKLRNCLPATTTQGLAISWYSFSLLVVFVYVYKLPCMEKKLKIARGPNNYGCKFHLDTALPHHSISMQNTWKPSNCLSDSRPYKKGHWWYPSHDGHT